MNSISDKNPISSGKWGFTNGLLVYKMLAECTLAKRQPVDQDPNFPPWIQPWSERSWVLRNILFVQFGKSLQSGKDTLHIHQVNVAFDAVAPVVFAKILPKKLKDLAG